jgi:hypothetical protein
MSMNSQGTTNRWTGRRIRRALLVPAVVMALMVAAAPAGASCFKEFGIATCARTGAIAKDHARARGHGHGRHAWIELLRKVG